ncbi:hypothetical protein EON80_02375, partial [bacterium]
MSYFLWNLLYFMKDRMNSDLLPGPPPRSSRSRRALAQPRFLISTMAVAMAGFAYLATAQTGRAPVPMNSASSSAGEKPLELSNLPAMMAAYGESRQAGASSKGVRLAAIGTGNNGYNLTEGDLTPNTPSDERQPVYSPNGDFIAFISNGKDTNLDGRIDTDAINAENRYHVWVMNRDGSNQRQITGLRTADKPLNQSRPNWSPNGTQLVYVDGDGTASNLYVVEPFATGTQPANTPAAGVRRSYFGVTGTIQSPAWAPSGTSIVFAFDGDLKPETGATVGGQYDLFSVNPNGSTNSIVRLTGGSADPLGNTTSDTNPAFASVNQNVLYFSSNRQGTSALTTGRRIWRMDVNGANKRQVSDPTRRGGTADDIDDFPAASLGSINERVAFQSNSPVSATDTAPNGARDYNVWSITTDTSPAPTPVPTAEPRVLASDFTGDRVLSYNPTNGNPSITGSDTTGTVIDQPEGIVISNGRTIVSHRAASSISAFDLNTADPAPSGGQANADFINPGLAVNASGMVSDGTYIYTGDGGAASKTTDNVAVTGVYRFELGSGAAAPRDGAAANTAQFTSGETGNNRIFGGVEGLTIDPGNRYLLVSCFGDNKVNLYNKDDGIFVKTLVLPGAGGLTGPTGLVFGPDLNGDNIQDLYVNSSTGDAVFAFRGFDLQDPDANVGPTQTEIPGTFISIVVPRDPNGTVGGLNAPEGIRIIDRGNEAYIYVSSFHGVGNTGTIGTGNRINRYRLNKTAIDPTVPSTQVATPAPRTGVGPNAAYITFAGGRGIGYFEFNQQAYTALRIEGTPPTPTPVPPPVQPIEASSTAVVVTNIISSKENYDESGLNVAGTNVLQDKANDVEPSYSRKTATANLAAQLTFASTRRYAPNPSSNTKDSAGATPPPSNPYGYDEASGAQGTHDIWGTSTRDTTPPALVPQAAGNLQYPVVAPHPDAPFTAYRTYEEGLRPGEPLKIAFVLSELESGVDLTSNSAVSVSFYRAGDERFANVTRGIPGFEKKINEDIVVQVGTEFRPVGSASFGLRAYDDGPGGHEKQANAVAGDGLYYCEATSNSPVLTPQIAGDYYIDINVRDRAGNTFTYDNVWGFSTVPFDTSGTKDLFVSDYAEGQKFPLSLVSNTDDSRFVQQDPIESHLLSNPGGIALKDGKPFSRSIPETFVPGSLNIWRVLCRGAVDQETLDKYKPTSVTQIDPDDGGGAEPFTKPSRTVTVSNRAVVWASPFAGTVFAGPGTIDDANQQTRLKNYLNDGGRLFVTGRDVAWALTNGGTVSNSFLEDELGADFGGETVPSENPNEQPKLLYASGHFSQGLENIGDDFRNLQIPRYIHPAATAGDYGDAALTQDRSVFVGADRAAGVKIDFITPVGDSIPSYTSGGRVVGQRIEKVRSKGLESRVAFFSFGFEAVNRRYYLLNGNPT